VIPLWTAILLAAFGGIRSEEKASCSVSERCIVIEC
jgi:hypothetical protein